MVTAKPLRALRIDAGLSQADLSARTRCEDYPKPVHKLTINALENGHRPRPHPSTMKRIADALGVPLALVREFQRVGRSKRASQKAD